MACTALAIVGGQLGLACSGDTTPAPAPAAPTTTVLVGVATDALMPGDCLAALPSQTDRRVRTVPCPDRHRAEVYGAFVVGDGPFPGPRAVGRAARERCGAEFVAYTGAPRDLLVDRAFAELVPTAAGWERGDRRALCLAAAPDGRRSRGSIADASRPASAGQEASPS